MNARTETAWPEAQNFRHFARTPALRGSPELIAAIDALACYGPNEPAPTIEEVRCALEGTGFRWEAGKLSFAPERAALVDELDELIEIYGKDMTAAYLFPLSKAVVDERVRRVTAAVGAGTS